MVFEASHTSRVVPGHKQSHTAHKPPFVFNCVLTVWSFHELHYDGGDADDDDDDADADDDDDDGGGGGGGGNFAHKW